MQNGDVRETDNVSLERLADINPDLLMEIKKATDEIISKEGNSTMGGAESHSQESSKQKVANTQPATTLQNQKVYHTHTKT